MTIFNNLPNELVREILTHMYLPELQTVARVNRTFQYLAGPFLHTHRIWKSKFEDTSAYTFDDGGKAKLLDDLLRAPQAVFYLRHLDIRKWYTLSVSGVSDGQGGFLVHSAYPEQMMEAFRRFIYDTELVPDESKDTRIRTTEMGDEGAIIALLCMVSSHLESLHIDTIALAHPYFQVYLKSLLGYGLKVRPSIKSLVVESRYDPLYGLPDERLLPSINLVCQIPSLCDITFAGLEVEGPTNFSVDPTGQDIPQRTTALTNICFDSSVISLDVMHNIIRCTDRLEGFSFTPMAGWKPDFNYAQSICRDLRICARDSLRFLLLRGFEGQSGPWTPEVGYLKVFDCLEVIDIESSLLLGGPLAYRHSLTDEFPITVKTVSLHEDMFRDGESYSLTLHELSEKQEEYLPQLQSISIFGLRGAFEEIAKLDCVDTLRYRGIEVTLEKDYDYIN